MEYFLRLFRILRMCLIKIGAEMIEEKLMGIQIGNLHYKTVIFLKKYKILTDIKTNNLIDKDISLNILKINIII